MGQSRTENILENMLGAHNPLTEPHSREEALLLQLLEKLSVTVLKWLGVTTTELEDGDTTNPIIINSEEVTAEAGDVVTYGEAEFVYSGTTVYGGSIDFTTGELISDKNSDGTSKTPETIQLDPIYLTAKSSNHILTDADGNNTVQYIV